MGLDILRYKSTFDNHFHVTPLSEPEQKLESYRLRYEVLCQQKKILPAETCDSGIDQDAFDAHSSHFGVYSRKENEPSVMVGSVRLVHASPIGFPMLHHCEISDETTILSAEASRLVVSAPRVSAVLGADLPTAANIVRFPSPRTPRDRATNMALRSWITIALYKWIFREARNQGYDHVAAAMEESLARLFLALHVPFVAIGPVKDYYGPVRPYLLSLDALETCLELNAPDIRREVLHEGAKLPIGEYGLTGASSKPPMAL